MAISHITSALKTFSGKPLSIASKALGVTTCAAVIYDSHINGREKAYVTDEVDTGNRALNQYNQYLTSESESAVICKLKKIWYDIQQSFPFYHFASRTKGYLSGFGATLVKALPLIGLSAVALKCKTAGKVAGGLLALNGLKTLLYDVVGIGAPKTEKRY